VVLVPVRQDDRDDVLQAVPDGREVGDVDPRLVLLGEQHPAVDDEQLAVELEDRHVAPDLPQAAQRRDPQGAGGECGGRAEVLPVC
jgi:hypothetical protein